MDEKERILRLTLIDRLQKEAKVVRLLYHKKDFCSSCPWHCTGRPCSLPRGLCPVQKALKGAMEKCKIG